MGLRNLRAALWPHLDLRMARLRSIRARAQ